MTRAEKVAAIRQLRAQGLTNRQAGARLGMTESGVRNLLYDPDGAKQRYRRLNYMGVCEICGALTDGSNGAAKAPTRCIKHHPAAAANRLKAGTGPTQQRLMAVIGGGTTRFTDIHLAAGVTPSNAGRTLHWLVRYGLVERVSRGQYRLRDAA